MLKSLQQQMSQPVPSASQTLFMNKPDNTAGLSNHS
jgi:hypothetical protein